ncbi:Protoglobin-domain-containing protein [Rutstroemia sp. NJR-2017a BVV2]|nr:Protoglobin-domain-containing protein [Rutstroemia sp. NJR-2017a BVV2]PQE18354.1 Protoglobin-domain-containing protein [Rutstroemia sp. NJR-2017a BVV2]
MYHHIAMASPSRSRLHIDRKELYTDLESRIHYLHSFLDFSSREFLPPPSPLPKTNYPHPQGDIHALLTGAKYIKQLIPAIVNVVYQKLLQYDITSRAFTTRSTSSEGPVEELLTEDSPTILLRKMFLKGYLLKLCSDPSKMEFWQYLDKVGMMHVGRGRQHPLHIEYIHIGVCLGFIQDMIFEAILSHPKLEMQVKIALVKAIGKVLWIQNDLFAKWYVRDGEEFRCGGEEVGEEGKGGAEEGEVGMEGKGREGMGKEGGSCPFGGVGRE